MCEFNHATLPEGNDVAGQKMTTGWPDEYYAVIFTTQRTDAEMAMYGLTSERMIELAQQQPGFLGLGFVQEMASELLYHIGVTEMLLHHGAKTLNTVSLRLWAEKNFTVGFSYALPRSQKNAALD